MGSRFSSFVCQPELKYINLALINIHYLIVAEPDGREMRLMDRILETKLLVPPIPAPHTLKVEGERDFTPFHEVSSNNSSKLTFETLQNAKALC